MQFRLHQPYKPKGDQPKAIAKLSTGLKKGLQDQVLLGVTGVGKTFIIANVINNFQRPTLVIVHNKTLAAQLASELREFFPKNAVHYFVSYYDYYQPEAYLPTTDTYIEKDADINDEIDRLRNAATYALLTRNDVIIVASVSCIYGLGSTKEYKSMHLFLKRGKKIERDEVLRQLNSIRYERNDISFERGKFRVRGNIVDVYPSYKDKAYRIEFYGNKVEKLKIISPLSGEILRAKKEIHIYPATHFVIKENEQKKAIEQIRFDLYERIKILKKEGKNLEAERLKQRTNYDLEMIEQTGYCSGIENYSLYFDNRKPGEPPATLLSYFPKNYLLIIDESHMTIPQINGMYAGDRSRKEVLVNFGFRLPTALDNRPLKFYEFEERKGKTIYTSATPGIYELEKISGKKISLKRNENFKKSYQAELTIGSSAPLPKNINYQDFTKYKGLTEAIIRPTGLTDPKISLRPAKNQIENLIGEIKKVVAKKQRVLVTTLTKKLAEDLSEYLKEFNIKVAYLHSDIQTLERIEILRDLRAGKYDVLVGVNLLREGLDLPEVSLVAILDADKEGFLRSEWSLIQVMGRAARHIEGKAIMYADKITGSMKRAIEETARRRKIQEDYNKKHHLTPQGIKKKLRTGIEFGQRKKEHSLLDAELRKIDKAARIIPKDERLRLIKELKNKMEIAARNLEFEKAAAFRDQIKALRKVK